MVTVAPGTTAPALSLTVPTMVPVVTCACPGTADSAASAANTMAATCRFVMVASCRQPQGEHSHITAPGVRSAATLALVGCDPPETPLARRRAARRRLELTKSGGALTHHRAGCSRPPPQPPSLPRAAPRTHPPRVGGPPPAPPRAVHGRGGTPPSPRRLFAPRPPPRWLSAPPPETPPARRRRFAAPPRAYSVRGGHSHITALGVRDPP